MHESFRSWTASFVAAVAGASAPAVLAQDAPAAANEPFIASVKAWDGAMESLRKGMWTIQSSPDAQSKDSRGRTFVDDLNERVLPAEVSNHLDELRKQAEAQSSDAEAVSRILAEVRPILETETYKLSVLGSYWSAHGALAYHSKLLQPWLTNASEADRQAIRTHLSVTDQSLVKLLDAGITQTSTPARVAALSQFRVVEERAIAFYNERRATLADQQSGQPGSPPLKSRERQVPCPAPVTKTSGKEVPWLGEDNEPPESVYPVYATHARVEGDVILRVRISETGCMESAEVARSSGAEDLDDAALLWAERAHYVPAVKDGKAAAGSFRFRVKFELKN